MLMVNSKFNVRCKFTLSQVGKYIHVDQLARAKSEAPIYVFYNLLWKHCKEIHKSILNPPLNFRGGPIHMMFEDWL